MRNFEPFIWELEQLVRAWEKSPTCGFIEWCPPTNIVLVVFNSWLSNVWWFQPNMYVTITAVEVAERNCEANCQFGYTFF